jgi:hypothetical protein
MLYAKHFGKTGFHLSLSLVMTHHRRMRRSGFLGFQAGHRMDRHAFGSWSGDRTFAFCARRRSHPTRSHAPPCRTPQFQCITRFIYCCEIIAGTFYSPAMDFLVPAAVDTLPLFP